MQYSLLSCVRLSRKQKCKNHAHATFRASLSRDSLEDALNNNLRLTDEKTSLQKLLKSTQAQLEEQVCLASTL